jgi:predicted acyltransferase
MMFLAAIYWLADVLRYQKWGFPFMVFGTNALFSFFLAGIWARVLMMIKIPHDGTEITLYTWFYEKVCVPLTGNINGSLMFAIIQMILIWIIALILYRKKIMIRL